MLGALDADGLQIALEYYEFATSFSTLRTSV